MQNISMELATMCPLLPGDQFVSPDLYLDRLDRGFRPIRTIGLDGQPCWITNRDKTSVYVVREGQRRASWLPVAMTFVELA